MSVRRMEIAKPSPVDEALNLLDVLGLVLANLQPDELDEIAKYISDQPEASTLVERLLDLKATGGEQFKPLGYMSEEEYMKWAKKLEYPLTQVKNSWTYVEMAVNGQANGLPALTLISSDLSNSLHGEDFLTLPDGQTLSVFKRDGSGKKSLSADAVKVLLEAGVKFPYPADEQLPNFVSYMEGIKS